MAIKGRITRKEASLIEGVAAGKTVKAAAIDSGAFPNSNPESARVQAYEVLRRPHVAQALEKALDEAHASLTDSARVIGEAHNAKDVRFFPFTQKVREPMLDAEGKPITDAKGKVLEKITEEQRIEVREVDDHAIRLKGAELAMKARRLIGGPGEEGGPSGSINLVAVLQIVKQSAQERGLPL